MYKDRYIYILLILQRQIDRERERERERERDRERYQRGSSVSSEYGICMTAEARFWPCFGGESS